MSEYPYPSFDKDGKPICQICGKSFLVISPMHLRKHNIKYGEYTKRFPQAPLSSEEFIALGKYGKNKDLFLQTLEAAPQDEPQIETLEIKKFAAKYEKPLSPMESMKLRIIDHLKMHFTNIKKDYMIRQFGIDNNLKFEFVTDFCDPVLKIVIQFPDVFWHNVDAAFDMNKNFKLSQHGWKVIEIPTNNPSFELIDKYIEQT